MSKIRESHCHVHCKNVVVLTVREGTLNTMIHNKDVTFFSVSQAEMLLGITHVCYIFTDSVLETETNSHFLSLTSWTCINMPGYCWCSVYTGQKPVKLSIQSKILSRSVMENRKEKEQQTLMAVSFDHRSLCFSSDQDWLASTACSDINSLVVISDISWTFFTLISEILRPFSAWSDSFQETQQSV